jgi:hypothetical protein
MTPPERSIRNIIDVAHVALSFIKLGYCNVLSLAGREGQYFFSFEYDFNIGVAGRWQIGQTCSKNITGTGRAAPSGGWDTLREFLKPQVLGGFSLWNVSFYHQKEIFPGCGAEPCIKKAGRRPKGIAR